VVCASSASVANAAPSYSVAFLGELNPNGINNAGQIVGFSLSPFPAMSVPPYSAITDLSGNGDFGQAEAVNASGVAVGDQVNGSGQSHAYLWSNGTATDLGTLGGTTSHAFGVNDNGQIVGQSLNSAGAPRAFYFDGNSMVEIVGALGTAIVAHDINNAGQIAGTARDSGGLAHPFLYNGGTMVDLGSSSSAGAAAINELGQVVGFLNDRAFYYNGSSTVDLGTLGGTRSDAKGINIHGVIVGESTTVPASFDYRAFVSYGAGMIDLNSLIAPTPGLILQSANSINDSGQIVGYGTLNDEVVRFLLTPVPEPSSYILASIGAVALGLARPRRK
jgi:probable HAF family extracellular repeat protein